MVGEICADIKNYFTKDEDMIFGSWSISGGTFSPSVDFPTNYVRIVGSRLNDGVHKISDHDFVDEPEFNGAIWIMSPPKEFLALAKDIADWQEKNGSVDSVAMSPYSSESFGGYSYSKESNGDGFGNGASWQNAFASRLKIYRRIRVV